MGIEGYYTGWHLTQNVVVAGVFGEISVLKRNKDKS